MTLPNLRITILLLFILPASVSRAFAQQDLCSPVDLWSCSYTVADFANIENYCWQNTIQFPSSAERIKKENPVVKSLRLGESRFLALCADLRDLNTIWIDPDSRIEENAKYLQQVLDNNKGLRLLAITTNHFSGTFRPNEISVAVNLDQLKELEALVLKFNFLKIPVSFQSAGQLRYLSLHSNDLTEIPGWIGKLTQLEQLEIARLTKDTDPVFSGYYNYLPGAEKQLLPIPEWKTLPESMRNLKKLKKLVLHSMELTELPDFIYDLPNLEVLELFTPNLTGIPRDIARLKKLRQLVLIAPEKMKEIGLDDCPIPIDIVLNTRLTGPVLSLLKNGNLSSIVMVPDSTLMVDTGSFDFLTKPVILLYNYGWPYHLSSSDLEWGKKKSLLRTSH